VLYNGSLIALDVGLVGGDWELSAAVWRNLFDARGWDLGGKRDDEGNFIPPASYVPTSSTTGRKEDTLATDGSFYASSQANYRELAAEEQKNLALADTVLAQMPYRIYLFTAFLRRDLKRLEDISDEDILAGDGIRNGFSLIARPGQDDVGAAGLSEREVQAWRVRPLPWEIMEDGEVATP
jgi:cytochrome b pre-mRNA-processing protein 3